MEDVLETADSIGSALRMRREARGWSLDQLSVATRIRPQYIAAIEAMRLNELPSRPFAVGYVRACASVLGLDPEQAAQRFKQDAPDTDQRLAAPVGVEHNGDPRLRMFVGLGVIIVAAIVIWNIAERVMAHRSSHHGSPAAAMARAPASSHAPTGLVSLGAPLPPPQESTTPEPYVTPGLPGGPDSGAQPAPAAPPVAVGTPFAAKGQVYGQPAAHIILQADKPASLVVRSSDGSVYFARELETGEAYGAPDLAGLTVEVSNPAVVSVYVDRALKGPLPGATTSLSSLTAAPAKP